MKIGIVSDAHSNETGLRSCLKYFKASDVKKVYFLGDAVGYFVEPNGVLELLKINKAECVLGNHDAMILGSLEYNDEQDHIYRIGENAELLSSENRKFMSRWQPLLIRELNGKRMLFVHGSPWDTLEEYVYPDSDITRFSDLQFDIVFMGHTHRQFSREAGSVKVINAGSCGLPRDCGNLAGCVVFDTETGHLEIIRIPINVNAIIKQYGKGLDKSVIDCLNRTAPVSGRIIKDG